MNEYQRLCLQLADGDRVSVYHARRKLGQLAAECGAKNQAAERKKMAAELADFLENGLGDRDTSSFREVGLRSPEAQRDAAAVNDVLRILADIADDKQVPAIAKQLDNFYLRGMACWCLTRMTGKAASEALAVAAVDGVGTEFRLGVINGLASKQGPKVVEALKKCLKDQDLPVRLAAAEALSCHADEAHDSLIAVSARGGDARAVSRVARAGFDLAENLIENDQKDAARRILKELSTARSESPQKTAATEVLIHLT